MVYTLITGSNGVIRDSDGARIAANSSDPAWLTYQAWLAAGNTPTAATPPPASLVQLTFLQFLALFTPVQVQAIVASSDSGLAVFRLEAAGAGMITLSDPRVAAGLDTCVALGLITSADKTRVLANIPPSYATVFLTIAARFFMRVAAAVA